MDVTVTFREPFGATQMIYGPLRAKSKYTGLGERITQGEKYADSADRLILLLGGGGGCTGTAAGYGGGAGSGWAPPAHPSRSLHAGDAEFLS